MFLFYQYHERIRLYVEFMSGRHDVNRFDGVFNFIIFPYSCFKKLFLVYLIEDILNLQIKMIWLLS